jgi:hypothetical protein
VAELILVALAVGAVVLAAWPLASAWRQPRDPSDQDHVTDIEPVPPRNPDEPLPGSRRSRERHGKP